MMMNVDKAFGSSTIGIVGVEEPEAKNIRLPQFPRGQVLNN